MVFSFGVFENSDIPESVVAVAKNCCSVSRASSITLGELFFFINEPIPGAILETFPVCWLGIDGGAIVTTFPKSSCEEICLFFKFGDGLKRSK